MRVEMLPALHGDGLLIEYGSPQRTRRILIDGGPIGAWKALDARIRALPPDEKLLELIVLTHVDTDHIEAMVRLFAPQRTSWSFDVKDVWFNGWHHLDSWAGSLGGRQGEFFSSLLARRLEHDAWNGAFGGKAVVVNDDSSLPEVELAGGMKLTLLSPTVPKLEKMRDAWRKDIKDFDPGDLDAAWELLATQKKYLPGKGLLGSTPELDQLLQRQSRPDKAAANGASIAFLAECADKSCLFLADAHPDVVCESLRRLLSARGEKRLRVDAVKVAHHGSKSNTTDELMAQIESPRFLISTNGAQFRHPDAEAVNRIIARSVFQRPTLYFNYVSKPNEQWRDPDLQAKLKYNAVYKDNSLSPLVVELQSRRTSK
jgi:hypothetical protein